MYTIAAAIAAPVVGRDQAHQDCACLGVVVTVPDGMLQLYAERIEDLETIGWGILAVVEEIRKSRPALAAPVAQGASSDG